MAIQQITYTNKEAINIDSTIPDKNKCNASDLNEIKSVVNGNSYETPKVSSQVDTDYKVNVLTSKNLFDGLTESGAYNTSTGAKIVDANAVRNVNPIIIKPNTTYIISNNSVGVAMHVLQYNNNNQLVQYNLVSANNSFTTTNSTAYINIHRGNTNVDKLQIEEGTTITTYEAFIPNTINVNNEKYTDTINVGTSINDKNRVNVLYSKNLLDVSKGRLGEWSGLTLTSSNGELIVNGTNSSSVDIYLYIADQYNTPLVNFLNNKTGTYTLSNDKGYEMYFRLSSGFKQTTATISPQDTTINCFIRIPAGTYNNQTIKVMLNEGSTALPYEPYLVPSINVDGEEIYNASKDVISIIGNPNYTISTSGAYEKVPLNIISSQIGNNFSLNNSNQIVCKKNGYIKINANINYTSINTSGVKWAGVFINNNNTITTNSYGVASQRLTLSITTFLIKVNANDVIDIRVYGNQGDTIRNDNFAYTYLTCEYV